MVYLAQSKYPIFYIEATLDQPPRKLRRLVLANVCSAVEGSSFVVPTSTPLHSPQDFHNLASNGLTPCYNGVQAMHGGVLLPHFEQQVAEECFRRAMADNRQGWFPYAPIVEQVCDWPYRIRPRGAK